MRTCVVVYILSSTAGHNFLSQECVECSAVGCGRLILALASLSKMYVSSLKLAVWFRVLSALKLKFHFVQYCLFEQIKNFEGL